MKNDSQFSSIIYEFLLMRFRFQYYKYGDDFPSIETLSRDFNVSPLTVKTALRRLRSEGYIDMHAGRPSRVLFKQSEQDFRSAVFCYYSKRRSSFTDMCHTAEVVLTPLTVEGFRRMDGGDFERLSLYADKAAGNDVLNFFCYAYRKLENPLLMNLFWEISLFLGLLFFGSGTVSAASDNGGIRQKLQHILLLGKNRDWPHLQEAVIQFQRDTIEGIHDYINKSIPHAPVREQLSFCWKIYYGRPQYCYSLAISLMHEIFLGIYRDAEYLPSYAEMSKMYGVSISTIRRTIDTLTQIGLVDSVSGIGTRILTANGKNAVPDFSLPILRRNLAFFLQAFELIIYSCEEVTAATLEAMAGKEVEKLICRLEKSLRGGHCEFSLWELLICIAACHPSAGIREVYAKIYGLFLWGYSLKAFKKDTSELEKATLLFTKKTAACLRAHEYRQCGAVIREFVTQLFPLAENFLLAQGIGPDELRISPSINLMPLDN